MRKCTKCLIEKELLDFSKHSTGKDGRATICKECKRSYSKEHYLQTSDRHNALSRERYWANLDYEKARSKGYRIKNAEKIREKSKKYYAENTEQERLRLQKWQESNPDRDRASRAKRRMAMYNADREPYTLAEIFETYGINCHLCGNPIDLDAPRRNNKPGWENGLQIDHLVPLAKGGSDKLSNVRPSHGKCNLSKGSKL